MNLLWLLGPWRYGAYVTCCPGYVERPRTRLVPLHARRVRTAHAETAPLISDLFDDSKYESVHHFINLDLVRAQDRDHRRIDPAIPFQMLD